MLNISEQRIDDKVDKSQYQSFGMLKEYKADNILTRLLVASLLVLFVAMFLPWTQNIQSKGYITTLMPDQRPQSIHSIISGRIEKWFVKEGDFVHAGDTIMFISEIKDEYFDPNLLARTEEQIKSKELAVKSYMEQMVAIDNQIDALLLTRDLKTQQAENYIRQAELKVLSDSIDLTAAVTNLDITQEQLNRMEALYKEGLKSLTDLEARRQKLQEAVAKQLSAENKLLTSRNELINARIELTTISNTYRSDLAKAESNKYSILSKMYDAEAVVTKMQNQYMNYSVRAGYYFITAPQDGYITKLIRSGLGETIKEGEQLVSVLPTNVDLGVEMYVDPVDLPLMQTGQTVRFIFDGWPSVAFSGWPKVSFGTFGGKVVAIDRFISPNGKYRLLVAPDSTDITWPQQLRVGSGASGMTLLKDVPVWYELWRQLNGFPPDFYNNEPTGADTAKPKK